MVDRPAAITSGGLFYLNVKSPENALQTIDGRWTVEVKSGSRVVVARCDALPTYEEALGDSLSVAQQGLDLLAVRGVTTLAIANADREHLVWWVHDGRITLRVWSVSDLRFKATATATVVDSQGNVVSSPSTSAAAWHESFRYFRLSQTTDDVFDAFRNLYLALESILSTIAPQRLRTRDQPAENEGMWFKRALGQAGRVVELGQFATSRSSGDPVQELYDEFYVKTRTAVFHSKTNRTVLLPHDARSRPDLLDSLGRLARLYLALAEARFEMRYLGGGMTVQGFDMRMRGHDLNLFLSDDESSFTPEDVVINPADGQLFPLVTRQAPEFDAKFFVAWIGAAPGSDITRVLPFVARVGATSSDMTLRAVQELEGTLNIQGIDQFEAVMGIRLSNVQAPRVLYGA